MALNAIIYYYHVLKIILKAILKKHIGTTRKKAASRKKNALTLLAKRKPYDIRTFAKALAKIKNESSREYFCRKGVNNKCMARFRKMLINASRGSSKIIFRNHLGGL